jgi:AcrR family transcriptional regulator
MSYIAERRQEERERRRTEIIQAAEQLYSESGWEELTMEHVARRARLSRALVYVYFRDKDDLHLAIVERSLERLRQRFQAAVDGARLGVEKVEAIGRAYVAFSQEVPHYFDACSRFHARQPEDGSTDPQSVACSEAGQRVLRVIAASIEQGVADGSIRADLGAPMLISVALWGFSHGIIQLAANKADEIERAGVAIPQLMEYSFEFLRRAMSTGKRLIFLGFF